MYLCGYLGVRRAIIPGSNGIVLVEIYRHYCGKPDMSGVLSYRWCFNSMPDIYLYSIVARYS